MNPEEFLQLGSVRYYPGQRRLACARGYELTLRSQSLEVLHLLANKPNQIVSKDEIFGIIWKAVHVTDDSLVQCVSNIRRVLQDSDRKILQTLPKRGYRLQTNERAPIEPLLAINKPMKRPAIAVMRFQNIGTGHTDDIIAAGLATDIHFNLAKTSRLFVVAQASANRLRHLLAHEIGEQLGVSYLIHGATQRCAKHIRATISLVEAESNRVLWTEQYDRPPGDFLQLQDKITRDVISELDHRIEQHEIKKAFSTTPDNLSAWELYHQGLWYSTQTNLADIDKAYQLLKQSQALDPTFAPTYAALSATFIHRIFVRKETGIRDYADQAIAYAYQCLEHDSKSGWGYWALGRALHLKEQYQQALDAMNLSIKYKPNFSWNLHTKAMISNSFAGKEEALIAANKALRLSPVDPNRFAFLSSKTMALINMEEFEEAAIWGMHAAREAKAFHMTNVIAAIALQLNGQTSEAKEHIAEAIRKSPGFCLRSYRKTIPHYDEKSCERILIINALKQLDVPENN